MANSDRYDLVIVGGGPGGTAAGVYAARKKIKTALVTESFGGQSAVSAEIQNWIGTKSVSGFEFSKMFEEHLRAQEDIALTVGDRVAKIEKISGGFRAATEGGKTFETKTVLIVSGGRRKRLEVPGEKELEGKGVSYCSICDAPMFRNKSVAIAGGGNSAIEAARDLMTYASKTYLLVRSEVIKGDPVTFEAVKDDPRLSIIKNAEVIAVLGERAVSGLKYKDKASGGEKTLDVQGVFVEIGEIPNSDMVKGLVELNAHGGIVVDPRTQASSLEGIWAAGDVSDGLYRQNNISAGDAVKAVLNIYDYLLKGRKVI